jgi:uptake hydrogenase large subunit
MSRLVVGPFNRVEGDLEVRLDVVDGMVRSAEVTAPMYRGFEQILVGRPATDALVVVPRICGICSVTQTVAAARALCDLGGAAPPPNGRIATNLTLACENLADHIAHFYLFFMPDFARPAYAGRPWHDEAVRRFTATTGETVRRATAARQRWLTLLGTLAGKWPHTMSIAPGGSSRPIDASERLRLLATVREFRGFLEQQVFGDTLEAMAALADEDALEAWRVGAPGRGDLRFFMTVARDLRLDRLGLGPGRYLCYGAYPQDEVGTLAVPPGVWDGAAGAVRRLDPMRIAEDVTHAWLAPGSSTALHPFVGVTQPLADKAGAYTWNKAPRLAGQVVETGAIARALLAGQPLVRAAVARSGGNVLTRVLGRLLELATVVPQMEAWLRQLEPGEPFHADIALPEDGEGAGLVEAARGALGHWVTVRRGRIARYQIIAPTSWNFSPRDAAGTPGALEAALAGTPVAAGESMPVAVQHVVRSFDPCMVCTVH